MLFRSAVVDANEDFTSHIITTFFLCWVHRGVGNFARAVELGRGLVTALEGPRVGEHFGLAGLPSVMIRSAMSDSLAELGSLDEAARVAQEGWRIAEAVGQPLSLTIALTALARVSLLRGEWTDVISGLQRAAELEVKWEIGRAHV